ncbi:hypothetical protein [Streptomyces sp. NPDC056672]|uniref:hypothetical protein n=1 Tax=Streptomyces sp. NPDC056672 TaxID=3345906 RepID=UPI0036C153B2
MTHYGTAQLMGDRARQCDATAVWTADSGAQAYVLLDGIGDTRAVRDWVQAAARRLARAAALHGDAEAGLRAERERYAAEPDRHPDHRGRTPPAAAAVVAVHGPDGILSVSSSGDARAYLRMLDKDLRPLDTCLRQITEDHNERRAYEGLGDRHVLTACLGGGLDDQETEKRWGHRAVETVRGPVRSGWLLLLSDGAYEPHEDADHDMSGYLTGTPDVAAQRLVRGAVSRAREVPRSRADNATALIALLHGPVPGPATEPAGR